MFDENKGLRYHCYCHTHASTLSREKGSRVIRHSVVPSLLKELINRRRVKDLTVKGEICSSGLKVNNEGGRVIGGYIYGHRLDSSLTRIPTFLPNTTSHIHHTMPAPTDKSTQVPRPCHATPMTPRQPPKPRAPQTSRPSFRALMELRKKLGIGKKSPSSPRDGAVRFDQEIRLLFRSGKT
jgi:hypothetical protein